MKILVLLLLSLSCASVPSEYLKTIDYLDLDKFMGRWYVLSGRFTPFEKEVYNSIENYSFNKEKHRIEIDFYYNKGGFKGPIKKIPQTATIFNKQTNAHWKVSPIWPLKFDYLVIDIDEKYEWVAIGVPSQKYLWIMARDFKIPDDALNNIILRVQNKGYSVDNMVRVLHKYE